MPEKLILDGGTFVIKGHASNGVPVSLKGNVKDVKIVSNFEQYLGEPHRLPGSERITMTFDTDATGTAYTINTNIKVLVKRSAQVEADDITGEAILRARKRVGAPEDTKFRIIEFRKELVDSVDTPRPVVVEFYWEEEV